MRTIKRAVIILAILIPFSITIPIVEMISLLSPLPLRERIEVRGITSLFSVQPAEAYTYQDVENAYNAAKAQYPNDYIWIEEFNHDGQKGYKIWRRPPNDLWIKRERHYSGALQNAQWWGYYSLKTCDGSNKDIVVELNRGEGYFMIGNSRAKTYFCDGRIVDGPFNDGTPWVNGVSDPCFARTIYSGVSCTVEDMLIATIFPIDECEDKDGDGVTTCDGDCNDNDPTNTKTLPDKDGDGFSGCEDCDNNDPAINPGATEKCDKKDNNCNKETDEGACNCSVEVSGFSSANIANGNLSHSQELFTNKGTWLYASMSLYYNSLYSGSGHLGTSWTHSYDIKIKEFANGSVFLREGNDRRLYVFSSGSYINQAGDYSTLIKNINGTYLLTKKDGLKYTFDTGGKLTKIEDRNNNTLTFTYSGDNLIEIADSNGRKTTLSYDSNNNIISITDYANRTTTLTYNQSGYLIAVTDSAGYSWTYTYDSTGRMLTKSDTEGNVVTYAYDSQGRIISSTDSAGKSKTITYPTDTNTDTVKTTTVTERDGGIWTHKYNTTQGVLTEKIDPQGGTTTYQYDSNRNLTKETSPDGTTTTYTYDTQGNRTGVTDSMGNTTTYTYNTYGQTTSIKDPQNNVTYYSYDVYGNLTSISDPSGGITYFNYDSKGNITRITSPNGGVTVYEYDSYNNITKITDPSGNITSFTYDSAGNMTSMTDSQWNTTRFEYNSLNQLIKIIDPNGNTTIYSYDSMGNKTSQTDANGNTTYYAYNYKRQLTKVTDPLGNVTTYTYGGTSGCPSCGSSGGDNLTSIKNSNGNITTYEYDTLGRLTKETDPLGNSITYSYNSRGNLVSKVDANGNTINYTYDSLGKLLKKKYPDNTEETFIYDSKGNILTATNQHISYTFTYDASGKPLSVTDSYGRTIGYQYDTIGNKTRLTYPDGSIVSYTYDNANRLTSIINGGGRTYSFQYDTVGRRTNLNLPNSTSASYTYDASGRLTNLIHKTSSNSTIESFTYTHDNVGNRLTKTNTDTKNTYTYDTIYRLLQNLPTKLNGKDKEQENKQEAFSYDAVGNRQTGPEAKDTYSYNQGNQLTNDKKHSYEYDANGNLIKKTKTNDDGETETYTYSYNYENRLTKVVKQEFGETKTVSFKYDPFGRRIEKKVEETKDGETETKTYTYVYDNENIILEYLTKIEDGKNKTEITRYIHGLGIDEPLTIEKKSDIYYYHADGLGSIAALTDKKQKVVESYDYSSFGEIKRKGDKVKNTFTYTGREWDDEIGLYYYRARYYDPKVGRFIRKDPFPGLTNLPQTLNYYSYVINDPVNFKDPFGLIDLQIPGYDEIPPPDKLPPILREPAELAKEYGKYTIPGTENIPITIEPYANPGDINTKELLKNPSDEINKFLKRTEFGIKCKVKF